MSWKPITYLWQWQLKSAPAELWPYVADTQRFNQASYLPPIVYEEEPLDIGGSRRIGTTSKLGISVMFEDYPFEWVSEREFSNQRVFESGPIARTFAHLTLEPNRAGTLLNYTVEVTAANLLGFVGTPYQFGWEMRRNFGRVFHQIDDAIQQQARRHFTLKRGGLSNLAQTRLQKFTTALEDQGHEARWVEHLAALLTHEPDFDLARLRPFVLADRWQAPRREILELFLSAAKVGLLNMRWDIMCPLCRGAKFTATSLDEVKKGVHCPTCNIEFDANLSQNVELTFTPHPQIKSVPNDSYCIGGPMVTPHILAHQIVQPGETRVLSSTNITAGGYRFRTQKPGVASWLELTPEQAQAGRMLHILAEEDSIEARLKCGDTQPGSPLTLTLTNHALYAQRVFVEQSSWYTEAVTAAYVTSLQHFRDLFSAEVLRPGEEIGVQGMTILFSDLVGSTAMYNRRGDAPSYALVREQFSFLTGIVRRHEGAIVKTIGDAIMAAFSEPANGVQAALDIQAQVAAFNQRNTEKLAIKLGLHHGPCIAVNLNGRLDYFGATVNLAARLEGQSRGGDVVISQALRHDPAVDAVLATNPITVTPFETAIKGFDEHFHLYRLTAASPQFSPVPANNFERTV